MCVLAKPLVLKTLVIKVPTYKISRHSFLHSLSSLSAPSKATLLHKFGVCSVYIHIYLDGTI